MTILSGRHVAVIRIIFLLRRRNTVRSRPRYHTPFMIRRVSNQSVLPVLALFTQHWLTGGILRARNGVNKLFSFACLPAAADSVLMTDIRFFIQNTRILFHVGSRVCSSTVRLLPVKSIFYTLFYHTLSHIYILTFCHIYAFFRYFSMSKRSLFFVRRSDV